MESCGPCCLKSHSKVNAAFTDGLWNRMMEVIQKAAAQTLSALPMKFTFI